MPDHEDAGQRRRRSHGRETVEFGRVVGLSDAVFGIAMTLLVFTLDASAVNLNGLAGVLRDQAGELIAFGVSFAVIANFWWVHHRFFASLGLVEPGLVRLNLFLLGAVALVPFPTSLLGRDPTARGAVVPYLVLLSLLAVVHLLLLVRADAVGAWRAPMPEGVFRWLLAEWGASAVITLLALGVAFFAPVAALVMLLLTWPVEALVAHRAPPGQRNWA